MANNSSSSNTVDPTGSGEWALDDVEEAMEAMEINPVILRDSNDASGASSLAVIGGQAGLDRDFEALYERDVIERIHRDASFHISSAEDVSPADGSWQDLGLDNAQEQTFRYNVLC